MIAGTVAGTMITAAELIIGEPLDHFQSAALYLRLNLQYHFSKVLAFP